jgi:alanine-synthesizing transaminase
VTDFRRVDALPPYAFAEIERLKLELRRAGEDVIDLGFGNPDVPPPELAVEKLREAALLPRNHRYSSSRGLPKLREAICDLYRDRYRAELDPEPAVRARTSNPTQVPSAIPARLPLRL